MYTTRAPGADTLDTISQPCSSLCKFDVKSQDLAWPPFTVRGTLCTSTTVGGTDVSVATGNAVELARLVAGAVGVLDAEPPGIGVFVGTTVPVVVGATVPVAVALVIAVIVADGVAVALVVAVTVADGVGVATGVLVLGTPALAVGVLVDTEIVAVGIGVAVSVGSAVLVDVAGSLLTGWPIRARQPLIKVWAVV